MAETFHAEVEAHLQKMANQDIQKAKLVQKLLRDDSETDLKAASRARIVSEVKQHSCRDGDCPVSDYAGKPGVVVRD
mgnify:CR=1 FL=1